MYSKGSTKYSPTVTPKKRVNSIKPKNFVTEHLAIKNQPNDDDDDEV